ncbi:MAG TPA: Gfo/Idh/MocA family oxidoreductase [Chitinophagaceae bacterium]|nr:Gfo/Idh/MocA family oxidoreductase [Chitinophagaceae bacterium]
MNKIRWGILGCGRIAGKFAADLLLVKDAELIAVGSRSKEKAQEFARKYPARNIHGSYEELAADPEVDIIYVATPHSHHHEHSLLCLKHNKAVLCEKAFAINSRQAYEMITEARSRNIFLMEALWSKFLPHYNMVRSMIAEGKLGRLMSMQTNFGFKPIDPVPQRIFDPALGGGTLLDIGIYNVFFVHSFLGMPDDIQAFMTPASTGVDQQLAVQFHYRNGALAQMLSSFSSNLSTEADIAGDAGRIRLLNRFYEPSTTIQYYSGKIDTLETIPFSKEGGWGYQYQVRHVHECLKQGLAESPVMTHKDSLELMELMDRIRKIAGIHYPADK